MAIVVGDSSEYFGHVNIPVKVNTVVECVPSSMPNDNNNLETEKLRPNAWTIDVETVAFSSIF